MSMYNLLFGQNPMSDLLLGIIGLNKSAVGRFRDVFISNGEIAVYTRNGGGNREHWNDEKEEGEDCDCTGCTITYYLPKHPLYLRDEDDDFDYTYATIYFKIPDQYRDFLAILDKGEFKPDERWALKFEEIKSCSLDELSKKFPELVTITKELVDRLKIQDNPNL